MTHLWLGLVTAVQHAITLLAATTGGSIGLAIITVSVALRIALLPLTIRLARRAEEQRVILERMQPELAQIKARFRNEPERLAAETLALYRQHGLQPFDPRSISMILLQLPFASALYSAISRGLGAGRRFLWIADLAKPDFLLVAITAALTFAMSLLGTSKDAQRSAAVISTVITVAILWRLSAAIGLYWAGSTAVGAVQAVMLRRRTTSGRAA
jgi:YidC/Oxa1 family membrane protein insertase